MEARKRRHGDRRDGYWLRDLDALHGFTPYLFPNRADNEAFIEEEVDLQTSMRSSRRKTAKTQNSGTRFSMQSLQRL